MKSYLSVIIPCYNEEKNLKRGVLAEVEKYLSRQDYNSEVIISDDGSTDKSRDLIKKFIKKHKKLNLLENKHQGKAFTVKSGIEKARGEISLFIDMDQSTPIAEVEKLLPFFEKGFDIVIGSRGVVRKNAPLYRQAAALIFGCFRRIILLRNINDTQCGFKAFKTEVARDLFSRLEVFKKQKEIEGWRVSAFDVELLFLAEKLGYKIKEMPVIWEDKDIAQGKKKNFLKESWQMVQEIICVRLNDFSGKYKK
ncbi:glycosyltransferase [Candidatus Microgenomates bacterium]|nr:glycosyltransferase [Candidatus Microgenomates bacterium]